MCTAQGIQVLFKFREKERKYKKNVFFSRFTYLFGNFFSHHALHQTLVRKKYMRRNMFSIALKTSSQIILIKNYENVKK